MKQEDLYHFSSDTDEEAIRKQQENEAWQLYEHEEKNK